MVGLHLTWLAAALIEASGAPAFAQAQAIQAADRAAASPHAIQAPLEAYARELDDPSLGVREAATDRLVNDEMIQTDEIVSFLAAQWEALPPEAVERFMLASRRRYIANPGAIGIQFSDSPIAIVQTVIDGTPAAKVLQIGDQFLELNGKALPDSRAQQQPELLKLMAGCKAGDIVKARIRRGPRELDVEFALADPRLLPRFEEFILQMQREMAQQWDSMRADRFPPNRPLMIDMTLPGLEAAQETPSQVVDAARLIEALNRRRVEISQRIAQVMESSSDSDSPERRRELQAQHLILIDEFARLNARLRLVEAADSGRRRR